MRRVTVCLGRVTVQKLLTFLNIPPLFLSNIEVILSSKNILPITISFYAAEYCSKLFVTEHTKRKYVSNLQIRTVNIEKTFSRNKTVFYYYKNIRKNHKKIGTKVMLINYCLNFILSG